MAKDEGPCTRERSSASATLTSSSDAPQICSRLTSTGNVETTSSRLPPSQGPFSGFACGGLGFAEGYLTGAEGWGGSAVCTMGFAAGCGVRRAFWTSARSSGDKRDRYSTDFSSRRESSWLALTTFPSRLPVA